MPLHHRVVLLAALFLAVLPRMVFAQQSGAQPAKKPNILVIWGDDIGTWNISHNNRGMMGYQTPNIDRVAKEGVGFTDYYARPVKERNLSGAKSHPKFRFVEADLADGKLAEAVAGAEYVFHLAAMPGLARSWVDFDVYNRCNLTATHRLLEALKAVPTLKKFVYASTSSVYGPGTPSILTTNSASSAYGISNRLRKRWSRL